MSSDTDKGAAYGGNPFITPPPAVDVPEDEAENTLFFSPRGRQPSVIEGDVDLSKYRLSSGGLKFNYHMVKIFHPSFLIASPKARLSIECPTFCPQHYSPMCGSDGNTYGNECGLSIKACEEPKLNLVLAHYGPCKTEEQPFADKMKEMIDGNVSPLLSRIVFFRVDRNRNYYQLFKK